MSTTPEEDCYEDPDADLLACGYPRDELYAEAKHEHGHTYHCHLSLDNYW